MFKCKVQVLEVSKNLLKNILTMHRVDFFTTYSNAYCLIQLKSIAAIYISVQNEWVELKAHV